MTTAKEFQAALNNSITMQSKAVVAMHLLRMTRRDGQKGQGANRDDHPIFEGIYYDTIMGKASERGAFYGALDRVRKYHQQLYKSKYLMDLMDPTMTREMMTEQYAHDAAKIVAEKELKSLIIEKSAKDYGNW